MTPLKIGAALMARDLADFRDWLIADQRDLEVQDFYATEVLLGDWQGVVDHALAQLDGFEGRLGIHGPFIHVPIHFNDPEIGPIVTRRFQTGLDAALRLGARQMVVHSPYTTWDYFNFDDHPATGNTPSGRDRLIEDVHAVLGPVVARAREHGVTLVVENIEDIEPGFRQELAASFEGDAVKLSIDTGHAHYAHGRTGAPPVDYFIRQAGADLMHVHLQDTDSYADRHWAPGRGTIGWHSVFAALADLDHAPHLVLELRHAADVMAGFEHLKGLGLVA